MVLVAWLARQAGPDQVRKRETFDSSATPKAGETRKAPKRLADIDTAKLTTEIQQSLERAKADDPKRLKARIVELEKQLTTTAPVKPAKAERVEVPMIDEETIKAMEATADRLETIVGKAVKPMELTSEKLRGIPRQDQDAGGVP